MTACKSTAKVCLAWTALLLALSRCAAAQDPSSPAQEAAKPSAVTTKADTVGTGPFAFYIPASQQWVDTKIMLRAGAKVRFTAERRVTYPKGKTCGPACLPRTILMA